MSRIAFCRCSRSSAERRIVDVSGDGKENCNPEEPTDAIRDQLVSEGVTINGLAVAGVEPPGEIEGWYREHVIGGPFSFVLTAAGFEDFPRAIRRKFLVEISYALADAVPLIAPLYAPQVRSSTPSQLSKHNFFNVGSS